MLPRRLAMLITKRRAPNCLGLLHQEKDGLEEGQLYSHWSIRTTIELVTITIIAEKALGPSVRNAEEKLKEHCCADS